VSGTVLEDVRAQFGEHGLTMDHVYFGLMARVVQLLEQIAEVQNPEVEVERNDSVALDSSGNGTIAFKNSGLNETWKVGVYAFKSLGGHTLKVEVYSDPSKSSPINLVDMSPNGGTTNVAQQASDRSSPVTVKPGHHLVFKLSGGTSGDTVTVAMQGWRQVQKRHSISPRRG